jgi:choline transport protein
MSIPPASLRLQEETEKTGLDDTKKTTPEYEADENVGVGVVLNASGHKQELARQFSLLSICSIGITTGNVWAALGGSIVRQLY